MAEKRNWLVFANRIKCHHAEALHELGFVNWKEGRVNMTIGDVVYMYMSDERRVRFKTQVIAEGVKREDGMYWQEPPSKDLTFKLKLLDEYSGDELDDVKLKEHGFKGGRSIERPMSNNPALFQYIEGVFENKSFAYIIDEIVQQEKSRELVKTIIPILIRWAKQGLTNMTYQHLMNELGKPTFSGIGKQLGYVDDVFRRLREETDEEIPTLNALVKSKSTGLPSPGFSYVYTSYDDMTENEKKIFVLGLNKEAIDYQKWDWVLSSLNLKPSEINITESKKLIRSGKYYGNGGEGEKHKELKEYIYSHPEVIGIKLISFKEMEHTLLSGDRLDVYFELNDGSKVAVEIKPSTSADDDILRGLFQCVKYKTILDAEDMVDCKKPENSVILVIGGELSSENRKVKDILGINIKEKVIAK